MSLPIPLTVRLKTSKTDRHITRELASLTFREVAVGGFASATMTLHRPLRVQPDEIAYYGRVYVYAGSVVVWEGRLEDPGRTAGPDGEVYELTAMGPSVHARDRTVPLIYVERNPERFVRAENVTPGGANQIGGDPGSTASQDDALILRFPDGLHLVQNSRCVVRYYDMYEAGQKIARYNFSWDAGKTNASYEVQAYTRTDGGTGEISRQHTFNTAGGGTAVREIVAHYPAGRNTLDLRIIYTAAAAVTVADDATWASLRNISVTATRYAAGGGELLAATDYGTETVLAHEVVADLLGRLLSQYDGAGATIATTSYVISQLSYIDGITPAGVLEDLMRLEPGYRWGAYESNAAGKFRFEWTAWPTKVRYETDVLDGYTAPGSADGLYNAVNVRWRDTRGRVRSTRVTAAVPVLDTEGIVREASLDLGDDLGSAAEATQAGQQYLAEHATAPNAGRLTIGRPVLDLVRGRMAQPWEIKAGELIRVRGILPRVDALNASTRDGSTVFRIWSKEYDAGTALATLELDSYAHSTARALADLRNRPVTRRR